MNIRKYILSICCISIIGCHGVTEPCGFDKTDFLFSVDKLVDAAAYESQSDAPDFVKLDHQMQALKEKKCRNTAPGLPAGIPDHRLPIQINTV